MTPPSQQGCAIRERLVDLLSEVAPGYHGDVVDAMRLDALPGWDSVARIILVASVEDAADHVRTPRGPGPGDRHHAVGQLVGLIARHGGDTDGAQRP